jgi:1,4-dihydroxy-6-naphthoate synthase
MRPLRLGFSSCPNDTFIFATLATGRIDLPELHRPPLIADVETLNRLVLAEALDVSKVSLAVYGQVREKYVLLPCGAALGHGEGPLLVSRTPLAAGELQRVRVAVPGLLTTAALLLRIYGLRAEQLVVMPFDRIPAAVQDGAA